MTAGIYKLRFRDGTFYIGKSNDIDRRWEQHFNDLVKGKHTKRMQLAYEHNGEPTYEILFECHPHHTDFLEEYFIAKDWNPHILNGTRPNLSDAEIKEIEHFHTSVWKMSTFEHLRTLGLIQDHRDKLLEEVSDIKSGTALENAEARIEFLRKEINELNHNNRILKDQIYVYQNRGFFARLFNL